VASTSLHHVADLDEVLDRLEALLVPGGVLVVVEWAWERWAASGRPWENYCRTWAEHEGLHPGEEILRGLDARFDRQLYVEGPYFFADLADTSQAEEQAAIDAGQIRAGGSGTPPPGPDPPRLPGWATQGEGAADRSAEPGQQLADRPSLRWRALWVRPGWWPPWRTVPGGWSSRRHR
jgi:SAM-dependent methyltransferase